MILLVSGTTALRENGDQSWLGQLLCPRSRDRRVLSRYAADNSAFSNFDADAFVKLATKIACDPVRPIFVAVPDVVGKAHETRHKFADWYPRLSALDLPLAYVLQDGERIDFVPWDLIAAVFIGGTTAFKVGADARHLVDEAKRRDKWVHMGRVNSMRRMFYAQQIGCDSVDGSGFSRFAKRDLYKFTRVAWNRELEL